MAWQLSIVKLIMLKGRHVELQICATYPRFPVGCSTSVEHVALSISAATDGSAVEAEHDTGGGIYNRWRTHHHFLSSDIRAELPELVLEGTVVIRVYGLFKTRFQHKEL